ncbi:hypothetical protein [Kitasatospora kifunensis]|uniref:Uncharacterized protein n=1 Tax=Kitasatospora kifunensis TaxID=58351 RepID=A0A7W7VZ31_KITKI|nr:hypothetical protein [Kitasatospora kifunensis]MBB4928141.1 hypothetical protein [Kitasatospora kifunensis]
MTGAYGPIPLDSFGAYSDSGEWLLGSYQANGNSNENFTIYPPTNGMFEIRNFAGLCEYEGGIGNPGYWDSFYRLRPVTTGSYDAPQHRSQLQLQRRPLVPQAHGDRQRGKGKRLLARERP